MLKTSHISKETKTLPSEKTKKGESTMKKGTRDKVKTGTRGPHPVPIWKKPASPPEGDPHKRPHEGGLEDPEGW